MKNIAQLQNTVPVGIGRHHCVGTFRLTIPPLRITVCTGVLTVGDSADEMLRGPGRDILAHRQCCTAKRENPEHGIEGFRNMQSSWKHAIETACLGKYRKGVECGDLTDLGAKRDLPRSWCNWLHYYISTSILYMCSPTLWLRCHLTVTPLEVMADLREAYERRVVCNNANRRMHDHLVV
jgi:hypothetical protein